MNNLILATIISSSLLIADNGVALPEYDLVKKDFINGEINNERLSQIILKDPRLVPRSRGGLKDDVDASSDGLGVLVIGKILNGSVDSIEVNNDNSIIQNKLKYLIEKYGDDAKLAGMSTIDYVKNGVQTGVMSGAEAETIKSNLSRDDIVSVSMSLSNNNPKISDIVTISTSLVGNDNDSILAYNWNTSSNVNIESNNGDNIVISFNSPGAYTISVVAVDPDGNGNKSTSSSISINSALTIKDAYDSVALKNEGWVSVDGINYSWDGTYWKDDSNNIERYFKLMDRGLKLENIIVKVDRVTGIMRTSVEFQDGTSKIERSTVSSSIFTGGYDASIYWRYYDCFVPVINEYPGNNRTKIKCRVRSSSGHIIWDVDLNSNFCNYVTNGQGNYTLIKNLEYPINQRLWNGVLIYDTHSYPPPRNNEYFECVDLTSGCINGFTENIDGKCEALLPL
jgi:hypothetical protein